MSRVSGVAGAAPILADVFQHLRRTKGTGWYREPEGVVRARVEPLTGRRSPAADAREEVFLGGRLPEPERATDRDAQGRVCLDPVYTAWFGTADQRLGGRAVPGRSGMESGPVILSPVPGTMCFLDADLPESSQRLVLRADTEGHWHSETLRLHRIDNRVEAELTPGRHRIEVRQGGRSAETWIEVRRL